MTWDDLLESWLRDRRPRWSERTSEGTRKQVAPFVAWCRERNLGPAEVLPRHLLEWLRDLRASDRRERTVRDHLERVRTWLRWAARRGLLLQDPGRELRLRSLPRPARRLLTVAEVEALLAVPDAATPRGLRDLAALELLYGTGLRAAEWQALDLDDLDRAGRSLAVRRGKGWDARRLPVGDHLAGVLDRYLEEARPALARRPGEPALFLAVTGGRLSRETLAHHLAGYGRLAGLGPVSPHLFRHAFATHLLENGAPLVAVQRLLGHRTLVATEVYTRVHPLELIREYRRTHPRARSAKGRRP